MRSSFALNAGLPRFWGIIRPVAQAWSAACSAALIFALQRPGCSPDAEASTARIYEHQQTARMGPGNFRPGVSGEKGWNRGLHR